MKKLNNLIHTPHLKGIELSISEALVEDAVSFADLMNSHYKRQKTASYFQWQYFTDVKSVYFLAKIGNQAVGGCGIQTSLVQSIIKLKLAKISDFIVSDEFRGTGIALKLIDAVQKWCLDHKIKAMVAMPNKYGNAFFLHCGFVSNPINQYILENYHQVQKNLPKSILQKTNKIVRFVRNKKYLKWRFNKNPEYDYQFITDTKWDKYIVTKTFKDSTDGTLYGDIVDISWPVDETVEVLLNKTLLSFKKIGIKKITIWQDPAKILSGFLRMNNFHKHPQERYFCIKLLNKKYPEIANFNNWFLVESDSDVY